MFYTFLQFLYFDVQILVLVQLGSSILASLAFILRVFSISILLLLIQSGIYLDLLVTFNFILVLYCGVHFNILPTCLRFLMCSLSAIFQSFEFLAFLSRIIDQFSDVCIEFLGVWVFIFCHLLHCFVHFVQFHLKFVVQKVVLGLTSGLQLFLVGFNIQNVVFLFLVLDLLFDFEMVFQTLGFVFCHFSLNCTLLFLIFHSLFKIFQIVYSQFSINF